MLNKKSLHNQIIYHILIDRFAGFQSTNNEMSPEFLGGTIKGITHSLPYLQDLGITTLWISPFYQTSAYHGYHITDFFNVDPHFGTEQDIKELIDSVHEMRMFIIADFVPNHCSYLHPFFIKAQQDRNSLYYKWFYFMKWPDSYQCFLSVKDLPKLNLQYPPARQHIIDAALYWLEYGFDGFRLDHVIGPSHDFWQAFVHKIKQQYPSIILIGEAWMHGIHFSELSTVRIPWKYIKWFFGQASDWLLKSYLYLLDGVLDFKAQQILSLIKSDHLSSDEIQKLLANHYAKYPSTYALPCFLDNHDMNRILYTMDNDKEKLKQAAALQFSTPQPVIIYYGTERGMSQNQSIFSLASHGDLLARKPMNWSKLDYELFEFYKNIIKRKKQCV